MAFTLKIETDNRAFADDPGAEVARILRAVAENVDIGADFDVNGICRDANCYRCGEWSLALDEECSNA